MADVAKESVRDIIEGVSGDESAANLFAENVDDELEELGLDPDSPDDEDEEPGGQTEKSAPPRERVGLADVVREVEAQFGKAHADVIRGLQAEYTRSRQSQSDMNQRLDTLTQKLESFTDRAAPDTEEDLSEDEQELLASITDEHRNLFRMMLREIGPEWARENGYVKGDDLEERERQRQAQQERRSEHQVAVDDGIERYGEAFGKRDADGLFVVDPEAKQRMGAVYQRIMSRLPQGAEYPGTVLDLFELAHSKEIPGIVAEQIRLRELGGPADAERRRVGRARGALVEEGSAGVQVPSSAIYKRGEPFTRTMRKAMAAAWKESR